MNGPAWATRFYAKVDRDGPVPVHRPDLGACHLWTASVNERRGGYGQFRLGGRTRKAHQVALELAGVDIPLGYEPDHLCRVHRCVRVGHLEPVTPQVNFLRGEHPTAVSVRTNMCTKGLHELTPENRVKRKRAIRECRLCNNEAQRRRRARARRAA